MKNFNFRAQASLITAATLSLTLFASHASAQGKAGTNGGGGGGVILCPGQAPELTDFWEYKQADKTGVVASRLKSLRGLSPRSARQHFAKNLNRVWDGGEDDSLVDAIISGMMETAKRAVAAPGLAFSFNLGDFGPLVFETIVDTKVADPKDSGLIQGLSQTNCKEERIAVTKNITEGEGDNKTEKILVHIRRPDLFLELPAIDQVALLMGHELIHVQSKGNFARLENLDKDDPSDSAMVRRVNAWIATTNTEELTKFLWRPDAGYRVLRCSAKTGTNDAHDSYALRMAFDLYFDQKTKQTILDMDYYKSNSVTLPVRADIPLTEEMLLIPHGVDTNVARSGPSYGFELKTRLNAQQPVRAKLFQADVGQNIFSSTSAVMPNLRETDFTIEFVNGLDHKAFVKVTNSKGGIEFYGEIYCNANNI